MDLTLNRRDILTRTLPAAAFVGASLGSLGTLMAQPPAQGQMGQKSIIGSMIMQAAGDGQYKLPPLPYDYDALEPHIDAQTMQLHHDKHHQGYVDGLNKAVQGMTEMASGEIDDAKLAALERNLSFNGGGHLLHTIFWATMSPDGGGAPEGELAEAINAGFGSVDGFRNYFSKAAGGVKGSGWGLLAYEPLGDRLIVFALNEHDTKLMAGACPLLPLDVWEHAYYLKYQNRRADYIKAWWNVVNWKAVGEAYAWARKAFHGRKGEGE